MLHSALQQEAIALPDISAFASSKAQQDQSVHLENKEDAQETQSSEPVHPVSSIGNLKGVAILSEETDETPSQLPLPAGSEPTLEGQDLDQRIAAWLTAEAYNRM